MPNLMNVVVGDKLYDPGERLASRRQLEPQELTVIKVARKYLTAVTDSGRFSTEIQFERKSGTSHTEWDRFTVYASKEQFKDRELCMELSGKIVKHFGIYGRGAPSGLNSKQLQTILDILEGKQ